jgi:hypothetical protein
MTIGKNPGKIWLRWVYGFLAVLPLALCLQMPLRAAEAEYGYLIFDDPVCSIWWAEGAYKVTRDDPPPKEKKPVVELWAAANEYEPFLLVLRPKHRMENIRVDVSRLRSESGELIPAENITACHVEYVPVTVPTDALGAAGLWPDPLPSYEGPFAAWPGQNHPLWITVRVPEGTPAGAYEGKIILTAETWRKEVDITLHVWKFSLPKKSSIRSAFGLPSDHIRLYHNLETREELEKVFDLYMENFREHRVCPISPFELFPIKVKASGVYWKGGEFVPEPVHGGKRALKVADDSVNEAVQAETAERISVVPDTPYRLSWSAKTGEANQEYTILIKCYNAEGQELFSHNILKVYPGATDWKAEVLEIGRFFPEDAAVSLHLFPTFRDSTGSRMGTAYFDDMTFSAKDGPNLLAGGDFEMSLDRMSVEVDFSAFDRAAERYLDEFGFNSFNLGLEGVGSGSFYSHEEGVFAGFRQGTPEYDKLFSAYLSRVQDHLAEKGWLGKEYIYWFDEPDEKDYPFVRQGMVNIRKAASKLTRFITEHKPGPDIMDVSEISCTIFDRVDPDAMAPLILQGREFWSYLCTGPKAPWVTLFIDHPAINLRIWLWMSYQFKLKGILVWRANYWTSSNVFSDKTLQNPWLDPMSYVIGYGTPYGQVNYWGNGDGRFLYPPNRRPGQDRTKYISGPVNSIRWEILREGIEDYEYFLLLENALERLGPEQKDLQEKGQELLRFPQEIFKSGQDCTKDPKELLAHRRKIALFLEKLIP